MKERILIIEDDETVARTLLHGLIDEGYQAECVPDGEAGVATARGNSPDLVILNLALPNIDGMTIHQRLRNGGNLPILMLTSPGTAGDRLEGADDCLAKPFEINELLERVRTLLRRARQARPPTLSFSDLTLDLDSRQAIRHGRVIPLTAKEYDLLEMFMRHPRQILSRDKLFDRLWGYDYGGESNVLEVYVRYLRGKIEIKGETHLIYTVRGMGYVLREP